MVRGTCCSTSLLVGLFLLRARFSRMNSLCLCGLGQFVEPPATLYYTFVLVRCGACGVFFPTTTTHVVLRVSLMFVHNLFAVPDFMCLHVRLRDLDVFCSVRAVRSRMICCVSRFYSSLISPVPCRFTAAHLNTHFVYVIFAPPLLCLCSFPLRFARCVGFAARCSAHVLRLPLIGRALT